jgi:pilus assembly protein TadC
MRFPFIVCLCRFLVGGVDGGRILFACKFGLAVEMDAMDELFRHEARDNMGKWQVLRVNFFFCFRVWSKPYKVSLFFYGLFFFMFFIFHFCLFYISLYLSFVLYLFLFRVSFFSIC